MLRSGILVALCVLLVGCSAPAARICGLDLVRVQGGADLVRTCDQTPVAHFPGVIHFEWGEIDGREGAELVILWVPDAPGENPRIWVLRPTGKGIEYLWRGSRMSGNVEAFTLVQAPGDGEAGRGVGGAGGSEEGAGVCLVTRESGQDGNSRLLSYRWTGFGFGHGAATKSRLVECLGQTWSCAVADIPGKLDCTQEKESVAP